MTTFTRPSAALSSQVASALFRCHASPARYVHSSRFKAAIAHPITAHGPPPKAPTPADEFREAKEQRQQQEETQQPAEPKQRAQPPKPSKALEKRFWRDVDVKRKPEGDYQVLLDKRPVRSPTKDTLSIPETKPQLAHAVALEWDVMTSAQQALKNHLIPLTSLSARAGDIAQEDAEGETATREQIVGTTIRYLDTDTLLCWVPERNRYGGNEAEENGEKTETLRDTQMSVAQDIVTFLSSKVWPGVEIQPLDSDSIMPMSQPQTTTDIVRGWIADLPPHDLAALERGVLSSKSLLVAVRLLVEWSENFRNLQRPGNKKFGIEEAAEASSLEVRWQTGMWGEVEDTHDVDKEDLRRQLGSVVVMVSGERR
ncbi:Mitochondrial molecular chaperone [Aspergillus sp. HF37]|nr:Mitochondrial molecular chaperone [Aspergillus sp. HF37]